MERDCPRGKVGRSGDIWTDSSLGFLGREYVVFLSKLPSDLAKTWESLVWGSTKEGVR